MKPADIVREILYPLTEPAILLAALFFWLIYTFAKTAAIFLFPVGLIGAIILVAWASPAFFRYLLYLLEARAEGKKAPALDAELFGLADKLWSLSPLLLIAALIWGWIAILDYGVIWASVYGAAVIALVPASIAILTITHSPLESVNPVAIYRMIRVCGSPYVLIPVLILILSFAVDQFSIRGVPTFLVEWYTAYQTVMLFTFTGALLNARNVQFEVGIDQPLEATEAEIAGDLEKQRQSVANHAYGFISRGNREGGFAHMLDWIQKESDFDAASAWFFGEMMKWESKDAALFYAQTYLSHLLHHELDAKALKLMSTCIHADPRWKPKADDRPHAIDLAEKSKRHDLLKSLRN